MAEFIIGMIDRCVHIFVVAALVAWVLGFRDVAQAYANLGALALGLALGRRWTV